MMMTVEIPESVRKKLKVPLGEVHRDFAEIKKLSASHRIIAIGDVCTLALLERDICPHLAVFDFRSMRKDIEPHARRALQSWFPKYEKFSNPPGTLSEKIIDNAARLIRKGGAVLIDGEEDLTALAFVLAAGEKDIVVYGQPSEGMVLIVPDGKIKKRIRGWLASAALGHEVEGAE